MEKETRGWFVRSRKNTILQCTRAGAKWPGRRRGQTNTGEVTKAPLMSLVFCLLPVASIIQLTWLGLAKILMRRLSNVCKVCKCILYIYFSAVNNDRINKHETRSLVCTIKIFTFIHLIKIYSIDFGILFCLKAFKK